MCRPLFLLISVLCVGSEISGARTLYVAQTGDGSTGTDWAGAYPTINQALTASASGDEIWVASGTYSEYISLATGVSLYGGFAGTEATDELELRNLGVNTTTIDYDEYSEVPDTVITGHDFSTVDGFTLTSKGRRRGITCKNSTMYIGNCRFDHNSARGQGGAGILMDSSIVAIQNCVFTNGRGVFAAGGGLSVYDSTVELTNCQITNNRSGGGAGATIESSSVTFKRCNIMENISDSGGGAISAYGSRLWMENCLMSDNDARFGGGLYLSFGSRCYLKHCTFDGNTSNKWDDELMYEIGEGIYLAPVNDPEKETTVELENCILWDTWGVKKDIFAKFLFVNSDVVTLFDTQYASITNRNSISQLPEFVDPANGNYHLKSNSPCIDSGTETTLAVDLDGNPRPVDLPGIANNPTAFDMGCYEFQLPRSDLNGDGKVDARDLLKFQEEWMREGGAAQE